MKEHIAWKRLLISILIIICYFATPLFGSKNRSIHIEDKEWIVIAISASVFIIKFLIKFFGNEPMLYKIAFDFASLNLGSFLTSMFMLILENKYMDFNLPLTFEEILLSNFTLSGKFISITIFIFIITIVCMLLIQNLVKDVEKSTKPLYFMKFIIFIIGMFPFNLYLFLLVGN